MREATSARNANNRAITSTPSTCPVGRSAATVDCQAVSAGIGDRNIATLPSLFERPGADL